MSSIVKIEALVEVRIVQAGATRVDELMRGDWILHDGIVGQVVKADLYGAFRVELKVRVYNSLGANQYLKTLVERTTKVQCLAVETA